MSVLTEIQAFGRFVGSLREFVGEGINLDEARAIIRARVAQREENFLRLIEQGVYGYPRSPYLPLLQLAQVERGDIPSMVRRHGLEGTLRALRQAGVYVTFEELKGRTPIVRHGQHVPAAPEDFDNPFVVRSYQAESGGSTGQGTRVQHNLGNLVTHAPYRLVTLDAHGILNAPTAVWRGILPDPSGLNTVLRTVYYRHLPQVWYSQIDPWQRGISKKYAVATWATVAAARLYGAKIPWPRTLHLKDAVVVARWAAQALAAHGKCQIVTTVSRGLRVALAAQEAGISLEGAVFAIAGEPVTPAKVRAINASGARCYATYGFTEIGRMGMGCGNPADPTDVHLLKDSCAVVQQERPVPGTDLTVPAFNVTSLLLTSPKLLLNAESDDFGILEQRSCGCALEECGLTEHLREIYSFGKLTGEGVTLVGSEMVQVIEEVLPARFGGSPLDYQLMEEEDEHGFTRLTLLISPRVQLADETAAQNVVLEALLKHNVAANVARTTWQEAGTLRVQRREPVWTKRGKLLPLYVAHRHTPEQ